MTAQNPFTPGGTVSVTGGSSASSAATQLALPRGNGQQVRINSAPANTVPGRYKFGDSTVQAAATDPAIDPGDTEIVTAPMNATHVAVFGVGGTPVIDFTSGYGR